MLPKVHSNSVCTYLTYHAAAVGRSHIVNDGIMVMLLLLLPGTCTFAQGGKRIHYIPTVGSDLHVHVSAMSVRGRRAVDNVPVVLEAGEKKLRRKR